MKITRRKALMLLGLSAGCIVKGSDFVKGDTFDFPPRTITFQLDSWEKFEVRFKGKVVTITTEELWEALQ